MKYKTLILIIFSIIMHYNCKNQSNINSKDEGNTAKEDFEFLADTFADLKIVRYQIPSWDKLSLKQKKYVYYLTQAGYAGREIIIDQNYRHNLTIKRAMEKIYSNFKGDKNSVDFKNFEVYLKRFWFSNGIHHHYSNEKFEPNFSKEFFIKELKNNNIILQDEVLKAIFDPNFDKKKIDLRDGIDNVLYSAVNMYAPELTKSEVESFYQSMKDKSDKPIETGLNAKLVKENGKLVQKVYKVGGMYSNALQEVVKWLGKAKEVAENQQQADALTLLIDYYNTGDLEKWKQYNIAWTKATDGDIDYINGFVEVYNDPLAYTGSFETIVQINDFDMTKLMRQISDNAQYFEDNSSIMKEHKREKVTGVSYKVVNVAGESGDASPTTPIGVNLPNSNWIRSEIGSKSVSLGNIVYAYSKSAGSGMLDEFAYNDEEIERTKKYGDISDKMHTALHEVIGHASGKINPGVGETNETLKTYSSTLEEARADLVGLYFIFDQKLKDMKLVENDEVGKAMYDNYLRNGLITQLTRIKLGDDIEEAHMRNRQLVSKWVFEKSKKDNVIELVKKDGKTFVKINDYKKLNVLFGDLLRLIQKIKSEGDYKSGRDLVENYGVKVDQDLHKEVLSRFEKLNLKPYGGFINPKIVPIMDKNSEIIDFKVEYPNSFVDQMLFYSKEYGFLPDYN